MRHGESTWNVAGRVPGTAPGVPLTPRGEAQARAIRLAGWAPTRVVSSDLERAAATAALVAEPLGLEVEHDARLREQDAGTLTGRLARELAAEPTPPGRHVHEVRWGGGESIADVCARVRAFVADVRATPEATVVVVSHGGTLQVLTAVLAGASWRDVTWDDMLPLAGVRVIGEPPAR